MAGLPSVLLFDLDDTILDDSGGAADSWRTACDDAARGWSRLDRDRLISAIESTRAWYWSDAERHRVGRMDLRAASTHIASLALRDLGIEDPPLAHRIGHRYRDLREAHVQPLVGAIEALRHLGGRGVTLGLITNGPSVMQRSKIERFGLAQFFSYVGIEEEVGVGKPFPEAYEAALRTLRCKAPNTWMVGDNLEWDVLAPQRLGIHGIWVNPTGATPDAGDPQRTIASIGELVA